MSSCAGVRASVRASARTSRRNRSPSKGAALANLADAASAEGLRRRSGRFAWVVAFSSLWSISARRSWL